MADDILDPTPAPTPGPAPEPEPSPAPEPIPEPEPSPEELAAQSEERIFQRIASWLGRRDRDTFDAFGNLIDQKLQGFKPQQPVSQPTSDPSTILEDADAWFEQKLSQTAPRVFSDQMQRMVQAERNYNASLIQHTGGLMDADPLFSDKEFGQAVINEIQKQFPSVNKGLPPEINAQLLINGAVANVYRQKASIRPNGLAGNKGIQGGGVGGTKPSPTSVSRGKIVKLSPDAQKLAQRWGYKEEDLVRVFKDESG